MDGYAVSFIAVGLALGLGAAKDSLLTGGRAGTRREYHRLETTASAVMMSRIFGAIGMAELAGPTEAVQPPQIYRAPQVSQVPPELVERAAGSSGHVGYLVAEAYDHDNSSGLPPMAFEQPPPAIRPPELTRKRNYSRPRSPAFRQKALAILTS
ncbi:MAG: hypothetical protein WBD38_01445 [Candidatus Dormiibacterota bacterium]